MAQRDAPRDPHRGPTQGTHTEGTWGPYRGPTQGNRGPTQRGGPHIGPTTGGEGHTGDPYRTHAAMYIVPSPLHVYAGVRQAWSPAPISIVVDVIIYIYRTDPPLTSYPVDVLGEDARTTHPHGMNGSTLIFFSFYQLDHVKRKSFSFSSAVQERNKHCCPPPSPAPST